MRAALYALILSLAACGGGGGAPAESATVAAPVIKQPRVLVQASDALVATAGYDLSIYPTNEQDPEASVYQQGKQGGKLILWPGNTKKGGFANFQRYVDAAALNPAFALVYLTDEMFWSHGGGLAMGLDEREILAAARYAHDHGIQTGVSLLPAVLLHPAFALADINALDVIALDIYPSIPAGNGDCDVTGQNPYTALLACSVKKLRKLGYVGEIWYITQAFGLYPQALPEAIAGLKLQQETIAASAAMGITAIVPWGQYLGAREIAAEPYLYQGRGSALEPFLELP